jgi:hypothetical protein
MAEMTADDTGANSGMTDHTDLPETTRGDGWPE